MPMVEYLQDVGSFQKGATAFIDGNHVGELVDAGLVKVTEITDADIPGNLPDPPDDEDAAKPPAKRGRRK